MTDISQLSKWNRDISRAIAALGTEQFFPALIEAVNGQVKVDYPQVWLYHKDLPPRVLYHAIPKHALTSQIDEYLEGPYREDPFYQTSMQQPRSKIYRLSRVAMGKLKDSDYYRDYYSRTGSSDEVVYLSKLHAGNVINLSMMRVGDHGPFSDEEYESLYLLAEPQPILSSRVSTTRSTWLFAPLANHCCPREKKTSSNSCYVATARVCPLNASESPLRLFAATVKASIASLMSAPKPIFFLSSSTPCHAWDRPLVQTRSVFTCRHADR
jgi:hypothetical protein